MLKNKPKSESGIYFNYLAGKDQIFKYRKLTQISTSKMKSKDRKKMNLKNVQGR